MAARLEYRDRSSPSCLSELELRRLVAARLGYDGLTQDAKSTIRVTVNEPATQAIVEMLSGESVVGRRVLGAPDGCRSLVDALPFAISLALDPLLSPAAAAPADPPAHPSPPEPGPAPAAVPASPVPAVETKEQTVGISFSLGALGVLGLEPAPTVGTSAQLAVRRGPWSAAFEGRLDAPAHRGVPGGQVSVSAVIGELLACRELDAFGACLLAGLARMSLSSNRLVDVRDAARTPGIAGARIQWRAPLSATLAAAVSFDLQVPLGTVSLRDADDGATLWSSPPVAAALGLRLEAGLP